MKPPALIVGKHSGHMEIRTGAIVPMYVMCVIGFGAKKKVGSLMSAPQIVRRYRHECDGMENPARGCIASGGIQSPKKAESRG